MTKKKFTWVLAIGCLLLWSCAAVPTKDINFETKADPKIKFSGYKTYIMLGSAGIVNDRMGRWEPPSFNVDAQIKSLVEREMGKHGISKKAINPDLVVAYALGVDMEALDLKVDPATKIDVLENIPQSALLIILMDRQTGFVIWAGSATAEVMENPDEKTVKARLDYAVTGMLKKLPK